MSENAITAKILQSKELPTLPDVATKLLTLTAKEDTNASEIAAVVSQDVSLTAKMLKVVNSSFYNFPQQISTINQAVAILGTNAVRSLVLSFSFLQIKIHRDAAKNFNFQKFWEKSLACGVSSRLILAKMKEKELEEGFIAGLLQNIGELILALTCPDEYHAIQEAIRSEPDRDPVEAEKATINSDHALIGSYVLEHWNFPRILVDPVRCHLAPETYTGNDQHVRTMVRVVSLAGLIVQILYSDDPQKYHEKLRNDAFRLVSLGDKEVSSILDAVDTEIVKAGEYFGFKIQAPKSVMEILQEANIRLSLVNMSYEQMNRELITAKVALQRLTDELQEKNRLLTDLANLDGLTGVYNHRYFQSMLAKEISRSRRNGTPLSLILMDVDNFKKFNDTYGHQTGDFVLREVCRIMGEHLREYDTLARYGGEEFVIILSETGKDEGLAVAEKIRKEIDEATLLEGRETYHVTMSMGLTTRGPDAKTTRNEFIEQADSALLEAKKLGKNRVQVFASKKKKWFG